MVTPHCQLREERSSSLSPITPITRSWTSATINYVTETSFGCAYPELTLHRRALVADMCLTGLTIGERKTIDGMMSDGRWLQLRVPPGAVTRTPPL